jgi:two-component system, chemotaxis family, chemotaxis protein CheY
LSKRVLIADDGYGDRLVLRDYCMAFGYHVVGEARTGRESLEKFKTLKPDIVLVDAAMPDMDGVSVVRGLLKEDGEASILICVAKGQRSLAVEALTAGAKDFITKPIDPRRLRRSLSYITF